MRYGILGAILEFYHTVLEIVCRLTRMTSDRLVRRLLELSRPELMVAVPGWYSGGRKKCSDPGNSLRFDLF